MIKARGGGGLSGGHVGGTRSCGGGGGGGGGGWSPSLIFLEQPLERENTPFSSNDGQGLWGGGGGGGVTGRFRASLKHKDDGQTKFIKLNSLRKDIIIKYWVSIGSIHREQG